LARAAASGSRSELGQALTQGFVSGALGAVVSYLHRKYDGDDFLGPELPTTPVPVPEEPTNR
jgi:hypothetical protein